MERMIGVLNVSVRIGLGFVLVGIACVLLVARCQRVLAAESVADVGLRVFGSGSTTFSGAWPKVVQLLHVFRDQGLILAALLGLSAFFSMAETSITTLWPWKVLSISLFLLHNSLMFKTFQFGCFAVSLIYALFWKKFIHFFYLYLDKFAALSFRCC